MESFTFLYEDDVRTSQETKTYGPSRPVTGIALLLYVEDDRTSQQTYLWTSTASYGDSFLLGDVHL
jgi:hypothetical protein